MTHIMVHMHFVVTSFSMRSGEYFAIFDRDLVEFNRSSLNLVITLTDLVTGAELRTTVGALAPKSFKNVCTIAKNQPRVIRFLSIIKTRYNDGSPIVCIIILNKEFFYLNLSKNGYKILICTKLFFHCSFYIYLNFVL